MSGFYSHQKSASTLSFDSNERSFSLSSSRPATASMDRPGPSRGFHSNSSSVSLGNGNGIANSNRNGGAPMHAMMVPGMVVPSTDRPDPDSPFSQWEAYIVKQTHEWSDKRAKAVASPPPTANNPRIVWADQIRKSAPQVQPLAYTKARDRVASPPPQGPPPPNPRGMLRKASFDMFRSMPDAGRTTPSPPSSTRPSISSPIMPKSILTTAPAPVYASPGSLSASAFLDTSMRSLPDPSGVPHNVESHASSIRSLSPLPLSLPTDDFSASLLIGLDKRASTASTSSGRAPGPSDLIAAPLPEIYSPDMTGPPSIADTYSVHSRRSSWASSVDLDPAIICTPPLSHDGWQDQPQPARPTFLAEYGLDQDSDESETECSVYPDEEQVTAPLPSVADDGKQHHQQQEMPPQPVFQRLEADLPFSAYGDDISGTTRIGPNGSPLPRLEISTLPREKDEVQKARARIMSPRSFRKAFSSKKKGSASGSGSASTGSRASESSPSLPNSSSEDVGKVEVPSEPVIAVSPAAEPLQLPGLAKDDMTSWAAAIPAQAPPPTSPQLEEPASRVPQAPAMEATASSDSYPQLETPSDATLSMPLSPAFSTMTPSISSELSRDNASSTHSFGQNSFGQRRHRIVTPGLTKVASSPTVEAGAAPSLDPHLARATTRARSSGSVSSHTPSVALSNSSSTRRNSRRSGRSRITDGMPSFANMASTLAVPIADQRRMSNRSLSSEGSIDNHSNASNGSSYAKVGGSSDEGVPALAVSTATAVKGVLRKRSPSETSSLLSPRKEVSFNLPVGEFGAVEERASEEEELLEHEQKQRAHLKLPPMKLQPYATSGIAAEAAETAVLSQDDADIVKFLTTFGRNITSVESLEVLDTVNAGTGEWPKRDDWDSLPAYLLAYTTTLLSAYSDDTATMVYSSERAPAPVRGKASAPVLSTNPLYTAVVRSVLGIASWERPLVSLGAAGVYGYSWTKGRLGAVILVGMALLLATQGAGANADAGKDLADAYGKIAPVLLGDEATHERVRNLVLRRSPRASLRLSGLLVVLAAAATRVDSSVAMSLPGLLLGLAVFVWLPVILHQPSWAPKWMCSVNPLDAVLYDVPTDAQHAISTLRRRAAGGDQLVQRTSTLMLSPTHFDHRVSAHELAHAGDVLDGAFAAQIDGDAGHLCVLASRVVFRALTGRTEQRSASLAQVLDETSACKITLDVRLEKLVALEKVRSDGLRLKLRGGQTFEIVEVHERDQAFNRILALAPHKWH